MHQGRVHHYLGYQIYNDYDYKKCRENNINTLSNYEFVMSCMGSKNYISSKIEYSCDTAVEYQGLMDKKLKSIIK